MWAMHLPLRNTQRRSSQCAEAGTPGVAQVSRIWFLALEPSSLPLLHGGRRKERKNGVFFLLISKKLPITFESTNFTILSKFLSKLWNFRDISSSLPYFQLETHLELEAKHFFFFFFFFFFFTEASLADKYLLAEKRREEGDRGESGRSDGRSCWNRWNVYDGALNRSIKRTWRARNARKPGAWLEQKKRLEWSSPWSARTIVTYILISTGVRLRVRARERGLGTLGASYLSPEY